jgi:ParB family transcriptional regulator, chromosome partitioning protein
MSRKRLTFDIDLPEDDVTEAFPAGKGAEAEDARRRGPMAAAIVENADALRDRAGVEAAIRAENDALAHEHVRLKRAGLIVDLIPLDLVDTAKLARDRRSGPDDTLAELVVSIRELGLSNPIRVEPRDDGRYELIQGFRRLSAFRQLLQETGDTESFGRIPAGVMARGDTLERLYRRMVDENLVRKDISFAEMALLALNYAADPHTPIDDPDKAVAALFQSAGYQKRSYIRNFIRLMRAAGDAIKFPEAIPRSLGLVIAQRIEAEAGLGVLLREALLAQPDRDMAVELAILRSFAGQGADVEPAPARDGPPKVTGKSGAKAKTTFRIDRPQGQARCSAGIGRLEIRLDKDFSTVDRRVLEAAVALLLERLDR